MELQLVSRWGVAHALGARWNQSRLQRVKYLAAGPEEKAAALDAAIEFEDRVLDERSQEDMDKSSVDQNLVEPVDTLADLSSVLTELKRLRQRLLELCQMVAGSDSPSAGPAAAVRAPENAPCRGGSRSAGLARVKERSGGRLRTMLKDGQEQKVYSRKIECVICGMKTGTRRVGPGIGTEYPLRHRSEAGDPCPGCTKPGKLVVAHEEDKG